jgi:membrane protease YdiL (CAAX protease family)
MSKKNISYSLLVITVFVLSFYGRNITASFFSLEINSSFLKLVYYYAWWTIPTALLVMFLFGSKNLLANIGLQKGLFAGFVFSLVSVAPMLLSSAIVGQISKDLSLLDLMHKTIFAGFFEEYFFRGFLFGILFRKLKWGFIPASVLGAVIFGLGHIYQGSTLSETIGVFAITAMGAIWFAWLYIEWNNNLWVPIFLHITMNLSWVLFDVSDNALGGIYSNVFRIITIALSIIITIRYHKGRDLNITRRNLLVNKLS